MFSSNLLSVRNRHDKMAAREGADFSMTNAGTFPMTCACLDAGEAARRAALAPLLLPTAVNLLTCKLTR
jgi:hypothetical protein